MTVVGYSMVICGYDSLHHRYRDRIEKVKFGVPLSVAFATDIPATLLVLLLKVNKEGPLKKDIWRAPGNQAQVRKLAHTMQHGRLVNISEISVYTAASVIKKFLSKLPGGIFGPENEKLLFGIIHESDPEKQRQIFCNIVCKMSLPSQHLLILLFGTFRIIADSSETFGTRMTSDAIGISVAPSLFHSCIHDARAKFEDVMRFKQASSVVSTLITGFGCTNMFSRDCYEFYARITGRTLRVDENWLFSFQFPTRTFSQPSIAVCVEDKNGHTDDEEEICNFKPDYLIGSSISVPSNYTIKNENESLYSSTVRKRMETDASTSDLTQNGNSSSPRLNSKEMLASRISASLGGGLSNPNIIYSIASEKMDDMSANSLSLSNLELVYKRQTKRMQNRSNWFLSGFPVSENFEKENIFKKSTQEISEVLSDAENGNEIDISKKEVEISNNKLNQTSGTDLLFDSFRKASIIHKSYNEKTENDANHNISQSNICNNQIANNKPMQTAVPFSSCMAYNSTNSIWRRHSWKTPYTRPHKSFDNTWNDLPSNEDMNNFSRLQNPIRRISTMTGIFKTTNTEDNLNKRHTNVLVRRKSSSSMKKKPPNYYPTLNIAKY